jgi:acetylornithine deacetylase/succinyl-diaminopimelate desuccinylase-like protein
MLRFKKRILYFCLAFSFGNLISAQADWNQLAQKYAKASLSEFHAFLSLPNDANIPAQLEPNILWAIDAFQKRGFSVKRLPTAGIDLLLAEMPAPGATKTILFYVQIDGQPVDPSKWDQPTPFTPTLKAKVTDDAKGQHPKLKTLNPKPKTQNPEPTWKAIDWSNLQGNIDPEWRIFARSASDAKGPINMFLAAIDAMQEAGAKSDYHIKVIMDNEEELGSPNLPDAVEVHREALAADMLVILDGPMHVSNRPTMVFGARGIATVRLTTYGPRVPQHSGHYGNYAPNPAVRLAQLIASMKDDQGRVTIPGFYDGIKIDAATRKILEAVPDDEAYIQKKLGIAQPDGVGATLQEAIQYPSLNVRGMAAGWVGAKVRTIIPAAAVANIDVRLVKESDPERLMQLIRQHVAGQGYHILEGEPTEEERAKYPRLASMAHKVSYRAFRTDLDSEIGHWLEKALRQAHGEDPVKIRTHGGSVPIAPFVQTLNVPAVIVPLVNPDNNQHSPNENIRLKNYFEGVKTCIGILRVSPN